MAAEMRIHLIRVYVLMHLHCLNCFHWNTPTLAQLYYLQLHYCRLTDRVVNSSPHFFPHDFHFDCLLEDITIFDGISVSFFRTLVVEFSNFIVNIDDRISFG